jgi:hypothetical protein
MDNNLINIDDLVRQRLGGGEEQERSGSWMRMKDLLDKEMPKEKPVGMYWRKIFGAAGLLLLVACIGVGGYELNSYRNIAGSQDMAAVPNTTTPENAPAARSNDGVTSETATNVSSVATTANNNDNNNKDHQNAQPIAAANQPAKSAHAAAHSKSAPANKELAVGTKQLGADNKKQSAVNSKQLAVDNKKQSLAENHNGDSKTDKSMVLAANTVSSNTVTNNNTVTKTITTATDTKTSTKENKNVAGKELAGKEASSKDIAATGNSKTTKDNTKVSSDNTKLSSDGQPSIAKKSANAQTKRVAEKSKVTNAIAKTNAKTNNTAKSDNAKTDKKEAGDKDAVAVNNETPKGDKNNNNDDNKKENTDVVAMNGTTPANNNHDASVAKSKHDNRHAKTKMDRLALSSHAPAATHIAAVNANSVIAPANLPKAKTDNKLATASKATNKDATARKAEKKTTHGTTATTPNTNVVSASSPSGNTSNPVVTSRRKGSRQVEKLNITSRYVKTSPTTGYFRLDTISKESITEEYDLAMNNYEPTVFGPPPYELPAPSATPAVKGHAVVTIDSRENNLKGKHSSSTSTIENLSAAFNDMKNQVSGMHFAAGLTAGVNGTFFGPSSFKGFQFGVTGDFVFNDKFSVMSEFKYVHRINNDYTLADNYYSYTPNASGGYTKELVNNPYSFSTLHSFELPISTRFCAGHFNFYAGPNFVYTFAINTGAYPLPDQSTAQQVATVGNDNAPKLKASDFDARFGIGYLVGLCYQVSPNVSFDLRNVQTLWDNAHTTGSQFVSGQLYKSPSIQLSIGYRLGNDRNQSKN